MVDARLAAQRLGISRAALWQCLRTKEKNGIVAYRREGRRVLLVDMDMLDRATPQRKSKLLDLFYEHYQEKGLYSRVAKKVGVSAPTAWSFLNKGKFLSARTVEKYIKAIEETT